MVRKAHQYCSAPNCNIKSWPNDPVAMFRFPTDKERRKKWLINCRRKDLMECTDQQLDNRKICFHHFEPHMFCNPEV